MVYCLGDGLFESCPFNSNDPLFDGDEFDKSDLRFFDLSSSESNDFRRELERSPRLLEDSGRSESRFASDSDFLR